MRTAASGLVRPKSVALARPRAKATATSGCSARKSSRATTTWPSRSFMKGAVISRNCKAHQIELAGVHGLEAHDHVHQNRKERDERGDDDLGGKPEAEPHDQERRDRDLGQGLQRHQV